MSPWFPPGGFLPSQLFANSLAGILIIFKNRGLDPDTRPWFLLGAYFCHMYEYDPADNSYRLTINYKGSELEYKLRQYHTEIGKSYWHLFSKSRVIDLCYDRVNGKLTEQLLSGQPPVPGEFILLIEQELKAITGR